MIRRFLREHADPNVVALADHVCQHQTPHSVLNKVGVREDVEVHFEGHYPRPHNIWNGHEHDVRAVVDVAVVRR